MARARIDDARHPLLRKARPLGQLELDRLDEGAGRDRYGATVVQEVDARTALTDFSMGGRRDPGTVAWSVNPYTGCQHRCSYCFVPDTMKTQRERWGRYVLVKRTLPTRLAHELRRRPRGTTYLSTATDPYQPVEEEHRITRRCLQELARVDWPVDVLTRSPLVLRDLDILQRFTHLRVGLSVPTLDDRVRRVVEPHAPPIGARLRTLRRLTDAGLQVYANHSPAYPFTGRVTPATLAAAFRHAGVQWVNASPWRRRRSTLPVVAARLRGTPYEHLLPMIEDDRRQARMQKTLDVAFRRAGVPLRTGFFNPPWDRISSAAPTPVSTPTSAGAPTPEPDPRPRPTAA